MKLIRVNKNKFLVKETKRRSRSVAQIDPNGRVVNVFKNLTSVARFYERKMKHKPAAGYYGIYGNLHITMNGGWKAYGFYHKYVDDAPTIDVPDARLI